MDNGSLITLVVVALMVASQVWLASAAMPPAIRRKEGREILGSTVRAIALARSGRVADGYELMRASLLQARDLRDHGGEPWAEELVRACQKTLDRYVARYGSD